MLAALRRFRHPHQLLFYFIVNRHAAHFLWPGAVAVHPDLSPLPMPPCPLAVGSPSQINIRACLEEALC